MRIGWIIEDRWSELLCAPGASLSGPRSVPAANTLARTYHDLHRHSEAQTEYSRALVFAPTNLLLVQAKAADFLSQGDLAGARAVIATALHHTSTTAVVVRFATFQEMMWVLPDDLRAQVVRLAMETFQVSRRMAQLYVQRVLLNLEQDGLDAFDPDHLAITPDSIPADEWDWTSRRTTDAGCRQSVVIKRSDVE